MNKKKNKLNKYNILTVSVFIIGFLSATIDFKMMDLFKNFITMLSLPLFWTIYVILSLMIIINIRQIIHNTSEYKIVKTSDKKKLSIKIIKLFLISYFIGVLITIQNAYLIIIFKLL